ncbi:MAG: gliding motility-associated C-terminal domain-containing protein [Bacteroidia bacterium]|nr:gliding motility-associated C-terminal domain-containing protein [Bacteroidia bacterium]
MRKICRLVTRISLACIVLLLLPYSEIIAQTYNDGPMELQVRLREINVTNVETDLGLLGVGFAPDELSFNLWARDNADVDGAGWFPTGCLTQNFSPPLASMDFNFGWPAFLYNGTTVPMYFDIRMDAWEDDLPSDGLLGFCNSGTRCTFQNPQCCGVVIFGNCIGVTTGDDNHCDANPFKTQLNYRLGPPCQWYNHGFVAGNCPSNNYYQPRIESFWRYTKGSSCNDAIPLGNFFPGAPVLTHFNSNECYSNNWPASAGNDVFYEVNVTAAVGLKATLCAAATFNTNLYILDGGCNQIAFNNNFCANTSEITIPLCTPGTYYIVVDGNTAPEMGTFTLKIMEDPTVLVKAEAGNNQIICVGTSVQVGGSPTATFGAPPYTYSWTPTGNINLPNAANPIVYPPVTTKYYVTVTDQNMCSVTDSMVVTVTPGPSINLGNDTTLCTGDSVTLDAGGPYISYFWSTGGTNQTVKVSSAAQYTVAAIDFNGCLGKDTIKIFNFPLPGVNLGPDKAICQGNSTVLNAGPGMSGYLWAPGGQTSQTISVNTSGNYSVTVTDFNTCTQTDDINITVNPLPVVNLGPDVTKCPGTPAVLNAGTGFLSYLWNTGGTNQTVSVTPVGQYSVIATDANNCQGKDTIQVFNHNVTPPNLGPDFSVCAGTPAVIGAGVGFNSYLWNTGATTQNISVLFPGTYWVQTVDINGCISSDTIVIGVNTPPVVNLGPDTTVCQGSSIILDAGPGFTSYSWSNGGNGQTKSVSAQGTYTVTVTDANGCTASDQIFVSLDPGPAFTLGPDTTICPGDAIILDPGSGFVSTVWNTGATTHFIQVSNPGSYTVTVTNANGCTGSDTRQVFNYPAATPNLGPDRGICSGATEVLSTGGAYINYAWSTGQSGAAINVTNPGTYSVVVTDPNTCTGTDTVNLFAFPDPVVDLGPDTVVCNGGSLLLDAGNGWASVLWGNGSTSNTFNVTGPGTYTVTVTDGNGCEATDQILVNLNPAIVVNLGPDQAICDSGFIMLDAGSGLEGYLWNDGSTNQWLFVTQAGNYSVVVTDQYGCTGTDNINISTTAISNAPLLGPDQVYCNGDFILLDPGDGYVSYQWNTGAQSQYLIVDTTGTFAVEVKDASGCRFFDDINITVNQANPLDIGRDTFMCPGALITLDAGAGFDTYEWSTGQTSQSIEAAQPGVFSVRATINGCSQIDAIVIADSSGEACISKVWIPNAFTPNGDFRNDYFQPMATSWEEYDLTIFDRWNKMLFHSENPTTLWDGTFNGNDVAEGVYMYRLVYRTGGQVKTSVVGGSVTLLR